MDKRAVIQAAIELLERDKSVVIVYECNSGEDVRECHDEHAKAIDDLRQLQAELESFQPPMHTISG